MSSMFDVLLNEDGQDDPGEGLPLSNVDVKSIISENDVVAPTTITTPITVDRFIDIKGMSETFINKKLQETDLPVNNDPVFLVFRDMTVEEVVNFDDLIDTGTVSPFARISSASNSASASSEIYEDPDSIHAALREKLISQSTLRNSSRTVKFFSDNDKPPIDIPIFPSIREIANLLQLTDDQKCAYYIMAKGYLRSLSSSCVATPNHRYVAEEDYDSEHEEKAAFMHDTQEFETLRLGPNQAVLQLHGKGGSGKSYIVRGLQALEKGWLREQTIAIVTITGVAAVNVNGITIESLFYQKKKDYYMKVNYRFIT
jgi:hypothetical protein